jgi:hypothetical protein
LQNSYRNPFHYEGLSPGLRNNRTNEMMGDGETGHPP